jgi:hypothetical protein
MENYAGIFKRQVRNYLQGPNPSAMLEIIIYEGNQQIKFRLPFNYKFHVFYYE